MRLALAAMATAGVGGVGEEGAAGKVGTYVLTMRPGGCVDVVSG